jgi:hypothetical protein
LKGSFNKMSGYKSINDVVAESARKSPPRKTASDGLRKIGIGPDELALIPGTEEHKEKRAQRGLGKIKVYDEGGDVSSKGFKLIDDIPLGHTDPKATAPIEMEGGTQYRPKANRSDVFKGGSVGNAADPALATPQYMPGARPSAMPKIDMLQLPNSAFGNKLPVYDEGGDVDINDGKHSLAVVEDGERVLTPEQNEAYKAAQGLPVESRTQPGMPTIMPKVGPMGTMNPPEWKHSSSDTMHPLGDEVKQPNPDHAALIQQDKEDAAQKGDLVGMGKALLADKHVVNAPEMPKVQPTGMPQIPYQSPTLPTYGGPGKAPAAGELIPATELPTDEYKFNPNNLREKIAQLKQDQTSALAQRTPQGQEQADRIQLQINDLQKKNPWGSDNNHPGALGKIAHVFSKIGNTAGDVLEPGLMELIPGTDLNNQRQNAGYAKMLSEDTENTLREADAKEKYAQATALAKPSDKPGDYQIEKDDAGNLWRISKTDKEPPMRITFDPQGQPTLSPAPQGVQPPTLTAQPGQPTFGKKEENKEQRESDYATLRSRSASKEKLSPTDQQRLASLQTEFAVNPANLAAANERIAANLTRANVPAKERDDYLVLPTDTDAEAKDKESRAFEAGKEIYGQGAEGREERKEQRDQDRKDKNAVVYANDDHGQLIKTNRYDAIKRNVPYEEMSIGDMDKDRQALRQLNDVQLNTSRYTKAANEALKKEPTTGDYTNIHSILNKAGALDLNVAIGEGGNIKIPVLSSLIEGLNREVNSEAYAALSLQAKGLIDGYIRTLSAIPAYQKALTQIGRSNKETLDLELSNIPNPTMKPADIIRKQNQFQENIDRASEGFPINLPGLKSPKQVREETEGKTGEETEDKTGASGGRKLPQGW